MSRVLRFAFLEVGRFDKPKEECHSFEDRFLFMMKNLPTFVEKPELWDDPYFNELMEEAEFANMTLEQRWQYAMAMKNKWDNKNTLDFAEKKGREEERWKNAANLKNLGVDIAIIAQATGLTVEQVKAL